jgi:hypothetical protein
MWPAVWLKTHAGLLSPCQFGATRVLVSEASNSDPDDAGQRHAVLVGPGGASSTRRATIVSSAMQSLSRLLASTTASTRSSKRPRRSASQRFMPRPRDNTECGIRSSPCHSAHVGESRSITAGMHYIGAGFGASIPSGVAAASSSASWWRLAWSSVWRRGCLIRRSAQK